MASVACRTCQVVLPVSGHLEGRQVNARSGSKQSTPVKVSSLSPTFGLRLSQLQRHTTAASRGRKGPRQSVQVKAMMNPQEDPILNEAFKEPVAFFGGLFSGLLRLDLKEEPLKDWLEKTADAAGVKPDGSNNVVVEDEEGPVEIDIEID